MTKCPSQLVGAMTVNSEHNWGVARFGLFLPLRPLLIPLALVLVTAFGWSAEISPASSTKKGHVKAVEGRPAHFPHRIWAACDFEGQTPDYGWFGQAGTNDIPRYPGNERALS